MKPWSVKNRTRLFWQNVGWAYGRPTGIGGEKNGGIVAALEAIWHNITGPSTGCSCSFCFYSKRRKFPPGHPEHSAQFWIQFGRKLGKVIEDIRIQRDERHRRVWGGE